MKATAKIQGTRYVLQVRKTSTGEWSLDLLVQDTLEDSKNLRSLSLRNISDGLNEFVKEHNIQTNHLINDGVVKKLYQEATGDVNMEEHNRLEQEIQDKRNMMQDPTFQRSLVSEFNQTFNKQETQKPDKKIDKKNDRPVAPDRIQMPNPELKNVVSEMGRMIGTPEQAQPQRPNVPRDTPTATHAVPHHIRTEQSQIAPIKSSSGSGDLINELIAEQNALKADVQRINQRIEKIDKMLMKLQIKMK